MTHDEAISAIIDLGLGKTHGVPYDALYSLAVEPNESARELVQSWWYEWMDSTGPDDLHKACADKLAALITADRERTRREAVDTIDDEILERLCDNFLLRSSGHIVEDEDGDEQEEAYIYDRPKLKQELAKTIRAAIMGRKE